MALRLYLGNSNEIVNQTILTPIPEFARHSSLLL